MGGGDDRVVLADVDVDLGSDAEFSFEVNSRFDRKCRSRDQTTRIACFEIVDVGSIAMTFFADRVTGAMEKLIGVTRFADNGTRDIIDIGPTDRFVILE